MGRVLSVIATIAFLVLATPYLALTVISMASGAPVGGQGLVVFIVYAIALVVIVGFWVRTLRRGPAKP